MTLARIAPAFAWSDTTTAAVPFTAATQARPDANVIDLVIADLALRINGRTGSAMAVNGTVPGPLVRLREGQEAILRVTNRLNEIASIHWHGVLLPPDMDGVPGVSFGGIKPGETFTYRFPVVQSSTYWAHSHSGGQELLGVYFPLVIDPEEPEPFQFDRDYVVMFSDWSFETPGTIIGKLKKQGGYFNYQKRTSSDFIRDVKDSGLGATIKERASWSKMRMDPTDFADVTGSTYTYLLNGLPPSGNWTGVFTPGQKVRLRFIDAGAMTYFDIRIPGLKMTVVQADGQNVQPVEVDELRIGPGETYDVIVEPDDRAYTLFAETQDRSGFTRGTLAPRPGMNADLPRRAIDSCHRRRRGRPLGHALSPVAAHGNGYVPRGGSLAGSDGDDMTMALRPILLATCMLVATAARGMAQEVSPAPIAAATPQAITLPNVTEQAGWPEPVTDRETFGYLLLDNTEFQRQNGGPNAFRWDSFGWRGGDVHRFWVKSEGRIATESSEGTEIEAQGLYGKLISAFFDLQAGVRVRGGTDPTRVYAVLGLQGLSPYRFEIEPTVFVSHKGQVSGRFTATYDVLLAQRLILQPRIETNVAVQRDEAIGVGTGWNDAELGARLRYEIRREFAPYVGLTWKESFGATHRLTVRDGGDASHFVVVAGVRAWF